MELPIKIMITLFVALIVALVVIGFSNKMINDAKEKVKEIGGNDFPEQERIIEVHKVTSYQIASLAEECFRKSKDMLASEVCFAVIGSVEASESEIMRNLVELKEENLTIQLSNAKNAVRIRYNAATDKIEILG
jgi:RNA processing factor Prp31